MGGKNHQPCGQYLKNSTMMSLEMSRAMIAVEMANVALEETILAELDGKTGKTESIVSYLVASGAHLDSMMTSVGALHDQMVELDYQDLPPLKTLDLEALGDGLFEENLLTSSAAWDDVVDIMTTQGFWGILPAFEEHITHLKRLTDELRDKIVAVYDKAQEGEMHLILEENGAGNFKAEFARLYTSWADFQHFFLASSLLSTEVWYQFNRSGSLIENVGVRAVA